MNIAAALTDLGLQIGLPNLALDETGFSNVVFDEQLVVELQSLNDGKLLHLCAPITAVSLTEPDVPQLQAMLEANFLGGTLSGARFSIRKDEDEDEVGEAVFELTLTVEAMTSTDFCKAVESFLNDLETWQTALGAYVPPFLEMEMLEEA